MSKPASTLDQYLTAPAADRLLGVSKFAAYLSPPAVARLLGIHPDKVRNWCKSGELKAANLAENHSGQRCRYRISPEALDAFLARRAATPPPKSKRRCRKPQQSVTEYY